MKLSPDVFIVWCGVLRRNIRARLLLLTGVTSVHVSYPSATRNLRIEMAQQGLRIDRLQHAGVMPKSDHLLRAAGCSIGVDTLSYNSHTTGADSLWSGLPTITLPGRAFSARVAASLSTSTGTPALQVATLKAYEDYVIDLAHFHHGAAFPRLDGRSSLRDRGSASLLSGDLEGSRQHGQQEMLQRHERVYGTFALSLSDFVGSRESVTHGTERGRPSN